MKAIIGLGNPDLKYKTTRHNTGFLILDEILSAHSVTLSDKFNSFFGKKGDVLYLMPKTYMNLSGRAIIELMNFYKLTNKDILVIYDDATIEFGTFRFRKSGSFGGHNGIKSIAAHLGSDNFPRIKVGIGAKPHPEMDLADWVLSKFTDSEKKDLFNTFEGVYNSAILIADGKTSDAMNKYNS